jgi:hypothetical protein
MQKFDTPNPVSVIVEIPAGQIRFVASERTDTTVEVLPAEASKKRDVKAAEQTAVEYSEGVLRVVTADPNKLFGSSGSLTVTIALPAGSRVTGKAGAAALASTGRLAEVVFDGGYRTVELDEVGTAQLKVHTGEVTVARLTGPAHITNGQGDITVAEAVAGVVELRTGSGNLSVTAAPGVSGTLDASTTYGRISNAMQNTDGAGSALTVKATTSQGDITAASR